MKLLYIFKKYLQKPFIFPFESYRCKQKYSR
jgi:hypothetical protein